MDNVNKLAIRGASGGAIIAVKVVPGASRDRIAGVLGDCLKITTSSPAEGGKANAAVARILAEALGLDRRAVQLVSGPASPRKEFRLAGVTAANVVCRLERLR